MRIYFIGQKGIPAIAGGIERHVEELSIRMAEQGHEVFVYARNYYTPNDTVDFKGVKIIHLPTIRSKNFDAITHAFLATIHVLFQKADVIHYQGIGPSILLWIPKLFKRNTKIFCTVHSDDRQHQKWSSFAKVMLGLGAKVGIRFADKAIAVSKYQKEMFEEEFGGDLAYIPNGVPTYPKFQADVITKRWGLNGQDYILLVSRLVKHKGVHYALEAFKLLKNPDFKLVIAGGSAHTDEYEAQLKKMAGDSPNIIFTGEVKGLPLFELFSNAYLFVIPSEYEGLSIALLEAMSYGTPILSSDIPPNVESLGGFGFTFKNKDVTDLKNKMQYLLENKELVSKSSEDLKKRVREEYDWEVVTLKTLELYNSIVR